MPRKLKFEIPPSSQELEASIEKVTREKIYGSVDVEVFDENGNQCQLLSLAGDGKTIFGSGSVANVVIDQDGNPADKAALTAATPEGEPIEPFKSTFSKTIQLQEKTTVDDYMSHIIKSVYQLDSENISDYEDLVNLLEDGSIYKFEFSYRDGIVRDTAFLIANSENVPFMLLATPANIAFLSFKDASNLDADSTEEDEGSDLLDFESL